MDLPHAWNGKRTSFKVAWRVVTDLRGISTLCDIVRSMSLSRLSMHFFFLKTMEFIDLLDIHIIGHSGKDRFFFIRWNVYVNSTYMGCVMAICNNQSNS